MAQNQNQQGGNQPAKNPGQDDQQEQRDDTCRQPGSDDDRKQAGTADQDRQNR